MDNWTKIYVTTDSFHAQLVKGLLEENNIKVVMLNQKDSALVFGSITLMIQEEDKQKALEILEEPSEQSSDSCELR